jgi:hypothetical protein
MGEMLKALPQYGDAGFPIAPAVQEAPEAGDPMHGLTQGRRRGRRRRTDLPVANTINALKVKRKL